MRSGPIASGGWQNDRNFGSLLLPFVRATIDSAKKMLGRQDRDSSHRLGGL
jgi:hypothetical protein